MTAELRLDRPSPGNYGPQDPRSAACSGEQIGSVTSVWSHDLQDLSSMAILEPFPSPIPPQEQLQTDTAHTSHLQRADCILATSYPHFPIIMLYCISEGIPQLSHDQFNE